MKPILFNRADYQPRALERTWHQIEVTGEHPARLDNHIVTQVIDRTALEMIVDDFEDAVPDIHFPGLLVDADHLSHDPAQRTEAMGWLRNMEIRDGQLWGEIEWTDAGAAAVANRRYKFFSTEYAAGDLTDLGGGRVRPGRLAGLALTNRPNNRGGQPISNRTASGDEPQDNDQPNQKKPMNTIAKKLGLPEDADEAAILARIDEMEGELKTLRGQAEEAQAEEILNRHADRLPAGSREAWKKSLLINREQVEALLATLPPLPVEKAPEAEGRPAITNRATAATPDAQRATGGDGRERAEDQSRAAAIRNRAAEIDKTLGCGFDRAWNLAKAEVATA